MNLIYKIHRDIPHNCVAGECELTTLIDLIIERYDWYKQEDALQEMFGNESKAA